MDWICGYDNETKNVSKIWMRNLLLNAYL